MKLGQIVRRFLMPSLLVTVICALRYRCFVSPRAEVELSPLLKIGRSVFNSGYRKASRSATVIFTRR